MRPPMGKRSTIWDRRPRPAVREVEALTSEILSIMQPGESVNEKRPVGRPRPVAAG